MKYVVAGGGIAGVSCAKEILQLERSPNLEVILVSPSRVVKSVENFRKIGQCGEQFDVKETDSSELFSDTRFSFVSGTVTGWNAEKRELTLRSGEKIKYDKLCIATGARPRLLHEDSFSGYDQRLIFLRDTQSASHLEMLISNKRNLLIVGNGGIATELVYELSNVEITWLVRDPWIAASFFPADLEKFIERRLLAGRLHGRKLDGIQRHLQHSCHSESPESTGIFGPALGPDWCAPFNFRNSSNNTTGRSVKIFRNCVVENIRIAEELLVESLDRNDGTRKVHKPNIIIFAGGVVANSEIWMKEDQLRIADNGGISVNDACETSISDVYACGDVCSVNLPDSSILWNQRQLWTQARQQGEVCSRAMAAGSEEARMQSLYFELFTHCTTFFGLKVVFLGDYKPQKQEEGNWKVVLRNMEEDKLVRCVVVDNVIVGALLIGETDMEETLENLILNKTNLEGISESFLEPGFDLDDYFD